MAKLESMTKHSELRNSNYTKKAHETGDRNKIDGQETTGTRRNTMTTRT